MSPTRISFAQETFVREFDPIDYNLIPDLFYNQDDYDRFHEEEKKRWERAFSRRLEKMEVLKHKNELEQKDQMLNEESIVQRTCISGNPTPLATQYCKMATAA
jgi:hypothetical protein